MSCITYIIQTGNFSSPVGRQKATWGFFKFRSLINMPASGNEPPEWRVHPSDIVVINVIVTLSQETKFD